MTAGIVGGVVAAMDELEQKYQALVERISDFPMSEAAKVAPTGSPPSA